jgi:3-hydroxyisobutyrate dehydrogenase
VTDSLPQVGFVGLGNMGWPMARNLVAAGYPLVARDADADRQGRFAAEHGATAADSASAFAGAELVVTMLPDDRVVAAALLDDGIAAALPQGAVVVDMSSSNPTGTRALGERLPDGVELVDAPVSGGVPRAETGTLSIMVGGDDEAAIERARPLLEVLGERLFMAGPLGCGHALKALNNYLAAAAYSAGAEALEIAESFGLDPRTLVDLVNTSTGRSFVSEVVLGENVVTGRYATGFALRLLAKDVGIAADLAEAGGVDAPNVRLVSRRWAEAAEALPAAADHSEAHKPWWPEGAARFGAAAR